jgi:hypothetical protein
VDEKWIVQQWVAAGVPTKESASLTARQAVEKEKLSKKDKKERGLARGKKGKKAQPAAKGCGKE